MTPDLLADIFALVCIDRHGRRPWRWVSDGVEWVTDAVWIAWKPWDGVALAPESINVPDNDMMPTCAKIRAAVEETLKTAPLASLADVAIPPTPPPETCPQCKGTKTNDEPDEKCLECDGTGEVTCDHDFEHDCDECDGKGAIPNEDRGKPCAFCDGKGVAVPDPPASVPWAGGMWSVERLRVLRDHGALAARADVDGCHAPLVFRCGDVTGMMMARTA